MFSIFISRKNFILTLSQNKDLMSQSLRGRFPILLMVVFSFQIICFPLGLRSCCSPSRSINGYLLSGSLLPNSGPQVPLDTVEVNTPASEICVWRRKSGKRAVMQAKGVSENKDICVRSRTQGRGGWPWDQAVRLREA